jgi:hypothetical protein
MIMSTNEVRQKIPVPRRSFLWSLNETSGEILMHVGPTEFTPSANDRIVRSNDRGGFEQAPMEARPFVMARDGEYVILSNPVLNGTVDADAAKNGSFIAGGNKEKELVSGTKRIIPGPCSFPLWPGQSAEVRPAHKLGANQYLLVEVVGAIEESAPFYRLVIESAGLSSAVIDQGGEAESTPRRSVPGPVGDGSLRLGQRIVIQGRHTQLFIPPSGIEIVPPIEDVESKDENAEDAVGTLPPEIAQECVKLVTLVREGVSQKQFSTLKSELRHRSDLPLAHRAIMLAAVDQAFEARSSVVNKRADRDRQHRGSGPADPYARRAVVLGPKEFCILFDADGNPRIVRGPARVFPGPHDTFLQRGSRRRVYDAYELAEHQALWLRIITPITRERLAKHLPPGVSLDQEEYDAGAELIVRGQPSVFFPFIEAEVVNPHTREPHVGNDHDSVIIDAVGIDQKSGIYVRDLRTGMVKMVRGETSYLIDPRTEEHVQRRIPREAWNLWIAHAERHKTISTSDGESAVTSPWAVSIIVPNNEACLITSRLGRRVEIGPKVVLLEYEEQLLPFRLSKGPSKDGHNTVTTCFLRVQGARVADTFELESSDFVKLKVKLGFSGHFEGDKEAWFQVDDPVKLLADHVRAKLREVTRSLPLGRLVRDMPKLVKDTLFGEASSIRFEENGMVIDACVPLDVRIADSALAELFASAQRESVKLQINDEQASRRLSSERHQDQVDAEEHTIVRSAVARKAESRVIDAQSDHLVELEKVKLRYEIADLEQHRTQAQNLIRLDDELRAADRRCEANVERRRKEAEGDAQANDVVYKVEEAHLAKVAALDLERARAVAEAEAVRLAAIQPELIGALHSAADAEVMKAAATNMNLVSLLGGKTPQELFEHVLRGTPLERSARDMRARSEAKGNGSKKDVDQSSE